MLESTAALLRADSGLTEKRQSSKKCRCETPQTRRGSDSHGQTVVDLLYNGTPRRHRRVRATGSPRP